MDDTRRGFFSKALAMLAGIGIVKTSNVEQDKPIKPGGVYPKAEGIVKLSDGEHKLIGWWEVELLDATAFSDNGRRETIPGPLHMVIECADQRPIAINDIGNNFDAMFTNPDGTKFVQTLMVISTEGRFISNGGPISGVIQPCLIHSTLK
jgi:hypothetical protein